MILLKTISLYTLAVFFIAAGLMHFVRPAFYMKIMPPYIPFHRAMVYLSGVAEMGLGAALFVPGLSTWAAWGIIALLVAVFPANIHMYRMGPRKTKMPRWLLLARLPLQLVFIAWAYWHTW